MDVQRILIAERHPETGAWLEDVTREAFPDVGVDTVATVGEARERLQARDYNLVLLDMDLPAAGAVGLLQWLRRASPGTWAVTTAFHEDDEQVFSALCAGTRGYLLKDQARVDLVNQLRQISRDDPPLSPTVVRRILRYFQESTDSSAVEPGLSAGASGPTGKSLTARERQVVGLISRGFSRQDIAMAMGIRPNTAASYIKSVYRKLRVSGRAEATLEAVRRGLVDAHHRRAVS
ncbi:response regulator transcription factor [Thioalkalivibrio denitrificans]|uniref:response regulator transcription factor n=1 Tax=Thioalkalivibrio denitrificans TaxID=108003 RepID=UPI0009852688|nr:response regulator transcription factor [Thioalkalivibrio denitrificans]